MCNRGEVFNIQRFSSSDDPGIRTVVFLKGCPLNCAWCHNPESKNVKTEMFFNEELCIKCGNCIGACPQNSHFCVNENHIFDREKCVKVCPSGALKLCGDEKSAEDVLSTVLRDKIFYEESGGGMTVSGVEPLLQYDFTLSLLKLAKENKLHTAIETSGFLNRDLSVINQYTDLWMYDIKLFSDKEHIKYTGVSNKKIFENLTFLDKIGAKIILRCPIIPSVNFSKKHFDEIAILSNRLNNVIEINLESYHPLGISKAQQLGKNQAYKNDKFLKKSFLEPFAHEIQEKTNKAVIVI